MPLYEYRCLECERVIEVLQKFSDRPLRRCKSCKGKLEKLISRTSFKLKGGGWYSEGYGGPAGENAPKVDKTQADKSSSEKAKPDKSKPDSKKTGNAASSK